MANDRIIAKNRSARHEYEILETLEAGIELRGTEVKSVRAGRVNLKDSYATVDGNNEVYVIGMHISPYEYANRYNVDPLRDRKLLLNKREIRKLKADIGRAGYTLVPLDLHFSRSYVKMTLGVCRGKKLYDKREAMKKKDARRDMDRRLKSRY